MKLLRQDFNSIHEIYLIFATTKTNFLAPLRSMAQTKIKEKKYIYICVCVKPKKVIGCLNGYETENVS